ncbi:DUF937 domain-containing protein [Aequorivita viscosa]|nr:DUF937 domain-containing protein [Aequorivita viscosa]
MPSILDFLSSDAGKQLVGAASAKTGQSPEKTANVLSLALPVILGAMQKNAATPQGAQSLNAALENNRHDGSILNQLSDLLANKSGDSNLMHDGAGILNHVLGGNQQKVQQGISKVSGVDANSVAKIIQMAAPIIMGILGSQKRKDNVDENGLGDLLGSVMGKNTNHDKSLLTTLLDADGDGSVVDDIAGMVLGGKKKKGGIGGMLGGLFGK